MAIPRTRSRLLASAAPPPSPIATGKGLRSAAVDDQILSEYLGKTLQVPDLVLPKSHFSGGDDRLSIPGEIDFSSILLRENDSIRKLLRSVAEFGLFRLAGHGISVDELQSTFVETERVFQIPDEKRNELDMIFGPKTDHWEKLQWFRSEKTKVWPLQEEIGPDGYREFSEKMENMFSRLESVAGNVVQILTEHIEKAGEKKDHDEESLLCLYRYNNNRHDLHGDERLLLDGHGKEKDNESHFDHALSLYLFDCDQNLHIQSQNGLLSFKACSGTIVVAFRKQLEAWSRKEFIKVLEEPIFFEPNSKHESRHYLIEFMYSPSSLINREHNQMIKIVSLTDQIFIAIAIFLLYNFFKFVLSWLVGK